MVIFTTIFITGTNQVRSIYIGWSYNIRIQLDSKATALHIDNQIDEL